MNDAPNAEMVARRRRMLANLSSRNNRTGHRVSTTRLWRTSVIVKVGTRALAVVGIFVVVLCLGYFVTVLVYRPAYQSRAEGDFRKYRFPSVNERVKLYMSSWYHAPCEENIRYYLDGETLHITEIGKGNETRRSFNVGREIEVSTIFYYEQSALSACSKRRWSIGPYCTDALVTMKKTGRHQRVPVLLQFGDEDYSRAYGFNHSLLYNPRIPHIKKFRKVMSKEVLNEVISAGCDSNDPSTKTLYPIIWKLNAKRHFKNLYLVPWYDQKWENKINQAVFRGALTGKGFDKKAADLDNCLGVPRCRLAYTHAHSPLIDAKLTKLMDQLPEEVNGVTIAGPILSMREMMRYKGIILLEGNDVSSGLKWVSLSQSVVLMPPPTFTSWAMEELLEPWIHFIPLNQNLSDVEEKVQWMIDHDSEARRISHRAALWIKDLVFHPDADKDDALIYQEILRRYRAYFNQG